MKRLLTRQSYLNSLNTKHYAKYTGIEPINEEAAFANDAPWGDTLIGRLINSFARKGKIAFNKRRISGLSSRLKSIFDEMIEIGSIEIVGDSTNTILYLKISSLLGELTRQVKEEEDIEILISTTEELIDNVTLYKYDGKDIMLKALEEFLDFLKGLKSGKVDKPVTEEEPVNIYDSSLNLLQSVVQLHNLIISKQKSQPPAEKKSVKIDIQVGKEYMYSGSNGEKVVKVVDLEHPRKAGPDQKWLTTDDDVNLKVNIKPKVFVIWRDPQTKTYKPNAAPQAVDKSKLKPITGDVNVGKKPADVNKPVATNASRQYNIIYNSINESTESDNIWNKIVKSYNTVGLSKMIPRIKELIEKSKDENSDERKYVSTIGKQVIMNKSTVGKEVPYDQIIKEEVESIPSSYNDIPKAISLISRYILPVRDHKDVLKDKVEEIKIISLFIDSFSKLDELLKKQKNQPEEIKKESLVGYSKFLILLEDSKYHNQILEKFNELFTDEIRKTFEISDELRAKLENIEEYPEGQLVFTSSDPIIEIVRLFNRAWRIHTPGVIPSGRTNGRVTISVYNEYENLGESSSASADSPGSGPYRNIELYDSWFEGVQDIIGDTKYRPIFDEKVVFRFVNEETGQEADGIEKGGKILLKFINDLTSDSKMYKSGAINKFLTDYFKLDKTEGIVFVDHKGDSKDNNDSSTGIKVTDVDYKTMDRIDAFNPYSGNLNRLFESRVAKDYEKLAFKIDAVKGEDTITYFCVYVDSNESGYPVFLFSSGNYAYDMTKVSGISKNNPPTDVFLGALEKLGDFKVNGTANVRFIDVSKDTLKSDRIDRVPFKITKLEILCKKDTKEPYLDFNNYLPNRKSNITKNLPLAKTRICKP